MDGLCMLYPPKSKFLTPFKWQKKKRTKYFQQYVQDEIMIQAENNNIFRRLAEFSNVSGHFMKDINTCYGGCKHTTNGFRFLLLNYSRTSRYRHLSNTDTSILQTVSNALTKFSYILFKKEPLNTIIWTLSNTDNRH